MKSRNGNAHCSTGNTVSTANPSLSKTEEMGEFRGILAVGCEQISPKRLASVRDGPRSLPLKFGQHRVSNS